MKAIIVDDEINNITNLQKLLGKYCPAVNVVATATSADEAKKVISNNTIDLLFLDIQMPAKTGFDLLKELTSYSFQVIFVTAFDKYAIKAIKFSALDYLLKPINYKELKVAVERAESKTGQPWFNTQIESLLIELAGNNKSVQNIALPLANEIRLVPINDIIFCQSENNYTIFYLANEKIIVSRGLYEFQEILPEDVFIRCHQSYIINKSYVKSFHIKGSICFLEMKNKSEIPVSRSKREYVRSVLVSAK
jgi:two-component system LytT family response regulator